jgi:hypothetical protein
MTCCFAIETLCLFRCPLLLSFMTLYRNKRGIKKASLPGIGGDAFREQYVSDAAISSDEFSRA